MEDRQRDIPECATRTTCHTLILFPLFRHGYVFLTCHWHTTRFVTFTQQHASKLHIKSRDNSGTFPARLAIPTCLFTPQLSSLLQICRKASNCRGPHWDPGRSTWDLGRKEWHRNRFLFEYLGFPLSVPFHTCSIIILIRMKGGDRGGTVVKVLCHKSEGRWFDHSWCHWNFSLTLSFRSHYGPGVDSASNRNEYQKHFLGVKAAGA